MITAPTILGFAILAIRKSQQAESYDWKPSKQDVLQLRAELAKYEPKVINGRKQYPREQHLVNKGICAFLENGQLAVSSPELYKREDDIYGLHQWMLEKDQDQLFQAYPEERVAWEATVKEMFSSMRNLKELTVK